LCGGFSQGNREYMGWDGIGVCSLNCFSVAQEGGREGERSNKGGKDGRNETCHGYFCSWAGCEPRRVSERNCLRHIHATFKIGIRLFYFLRSSFPAAQGAGMGR